MRTLIQNRDLKTLFGGVSIAAIVGLLMGGAMYPNLDEDSVEGPQIQMPGGGPRSDAVVSQASVSAYGDHVPDYVVGTDALKPAQYQVLAYSDRAEPEYADTGESGDVMAYEAPAQVQPARWQDDPHEASAYPSQHGNVAYQIDLPAPPAPPANDEDYTGDDPSGD